MIMNTIEKNRKYTQLNNGGHGYAVGGSDDTISGLAEIIGGEFIVLSDGIAEYLCPTKTVLVADSNGLWAVDIAHEHSAA